MSQYNICVSMICEFNLSPESYQTKHPFPYYYQDDILDNEFARALQEEILNLPQDHFDAYDNPFEHKLTLRDKHAYPPNLDKLFAFLESPEFVKRLSKFTGYELYVDTNRHFNGVHVFKNHDKLDIHVDAGVHPQTLMKKQVTLGIYLSKDWDPAYGCDLEIWDGENASIVNPKLFNVVDKILPRFNRLVIFTNTDNSWHGNPSHANCPPNSKRIFVTISYLSNSTEFQNKRQKAYFVARPNDPIDSEKDRLRALRADPIAYKELYRYTTGMTK